MGGNGILFRCHRSSTSSRCSLQQLFIFLPVENLLDGFIPHVLYCLSRTSVNFPNHQQNGFTAPCADQF